MDSLHFIWHNCTHYTTAVPGCIVVQTSAIVISHSDNTYTHGHMDIIISSLPCHCLQVWTWETFTKNLLRENQHKSPGFWLQQYRYLEWYLKVYTWVRSYQECIWTLDRIPRPGPGWGAWQYWKICFEIAEFLTYLEFPTLISQ